MGAKFRAYVKFQGAEQVISKLRAMGDKCGDVVDKALHSAAEPVEAQAQRDAPVLTGDLKAHIETKSLGRSATRAAVGVGIFDDFSADNPDYWFFQEYGTEDMPAQPFLRPALESNKSKARNELRDAIRDGVHF